MGLKQSLLNFGRTWGSCEETAFMLMAGSQLRDSVRIALVGGGGDLNNRTF